MSADVVTVRVELPENTYESIIERTYSGIWSNEIGDMTDMESELISIKLIEREASPMEILYGDVNNDGKVEIADVVALASYVGTAENNPIDTQGMINGDVQNKGDGLTVGDVLAIQQYLADIVSSLPV